MKRRHFVQLSVAMPIAPVAFSDASRATRNERFVTAGADRDSEPFEILDATFHVKVSGRDTEGRCVIFDTIRHQKIGPGLHLHTDCDEWFFVRDGEFKVRAGGKILRLKAGDSLLIPREMPHAFVKNSDADARLIVMHPPAGKMEEFFRVVSRQKDQLHTIAAIGEQYGIRFLGPGLTPD
jgi:mannose-6-phosphate isomerase-like protein (cupin superfamily)